MSINHKRSPERPAWLWDPAVRIAGLLLLGFALASGVVLWPLAADPAASPREIVVVARDMAFYLQGSAAPNPVLTFRAGETVRVTLRNEDKGFMHSFEIGAWGKTVPTLKEGRSTSVLIEVPNQPGQHEYTCRPHAAMMKGVVDVVSAN